MLQDLQDTQLVIVSVVTMKRIQSLKFSEVCDLPECFIKAQLMEPLEMHSPV